MSNLPTTDVCRKKVCWSHSEVMQWSQFTTTVSRVQACCPGSKAVDDSTVPRGWLPAHNCNRLPSTPIVRRLPVFHCRTHLSLGDHAFTATGPWVWNSLPVHIRQPDLTLGHIYRSLKMHFLPRLQRLVTDSFSVWTINILTYFIFDIDECYSAVVTGLTQRVWTTGIQRSGWRSC